jgi:hypothetical protein
VNISREKPGATLHHYSSPFEKEIGESLQRTLAAPWRLEYPARSVDVLTGTGQMDYTPDFLIANRSTGRAVAVEVKSNLSLSIPNILKLQDIQAALEKQGTGFFVVVHWVPSDEPLRDERLADYGLDAVSARGALHAVEEIEKRLGP